MSVEARVLAFASRGLPERGELRAHEAPDGGLLPSRLRRGTSVVTRLVADLVREVAAEVELDDARFVLGSAWGEIETAFKLMQMRHEHDGALSPARFTLSVHSAPLSVLGVALGDRAPSTAVAAGPLTFAMALLEGAVLCADARGKVVVVVADEPPPPALRGDPPAAAGVALVLGPAGSGARLRLDREGRDPGAVGPVLARSAPFSAEPLLEALRSSRAGRVVVGEEATSRWLVDVDFAGGEHG